MFLLGMMIKLEKLTIWMNHI